MPPLNAGNIQASLSLNVQQFLTAMQQASQAVTQVATQMKSTFGGSGGGGASGSINNVAASVSKANNGLKDMQRIVSGIVISQLFYNALSAIKDAGGALLQFNSDMQESAIGFKYLLGSQDKANAFISVMQDFAAVTPYTTQETLKLSRSLMAMGFAADSVKSVMTTLTDVASVSGTTREQMDRIVLAMGQIHTQGTLQGQEIRQLANANLPIYTILQKELGLTQEQMKNVGKLKIPADVAIGAILKGFSYAKGAAADVANTFHGMMSTVGDDMLILGSRITQGPFNALNGLVANIRDGLEKARVIFRNNGLGGVFESIVPKSLQDDIRTIIASFRSLGDSIGKIFKTLGEPIGIVIATIVKASAVVLPAIAGIMSIVTNLITAVNDASPALKIFAAAVLGIMVAELAAKSLLFLWTVTRMGTLCAFVAEAVMVLVNAIKWLGLMATAIDAPLLAIIGLTLYLVATSTQAADAVKYLGKSLRDIAGVDIAGILNPTPDASKLTDDYNKSLEAMNKNLQDTGKNAAASSKELKGWVASFDEVFQKPVDNTPLASAADFGTAGGLPPGFTGGMPKITTPKLPDLIPQDLLDKAKEKLKKWADDIGYILAGITVLFNKPPGGGGGGWMDKWLDGMTDAMKKWKIGFDQWWRDLKLPDQLPLWTIPDPILANTPTWQTTWDTFWKGITVPTLVPIPSVVAVGAHLTDSTASWKSTWDSFWLTLLVPALVPIPSVVAIGPHLTTEMSNWKATWDAHWASLTVPTLVPIPSVVAIGPHLTTEVGKWKATWDAHWSSLTVPSIAPIPAVVAIGPHLTTETGKWKATWDLHWADISSTIKANSPTVVQQMDTHFVNVNTSVATGIAAMQKAWDDYNKKLDVSTPVEHKKIETHWENHKTYFETWKEWLPNVFYGQYWVDFFNTMKTNTENLTKVVLPKYWEDNKTAILTIVSLMPGGLALKFARFIPELGPILGGFFDFMETGWSAWGGRLATKIGTIVNDAKVLIKEATTEAGTMTDAVGKAVAAAKTSIGEVLTSIGKMVTDAAKAVGNVVGNLVGGGGAPATGPIAGFAGGGILDKHSLIQMAENGREAAIPLTGQAMLPFAQAIAEGIGMNKPQGSSNGLPILYVHTLIADEAGLKALERKMNVIRLNEDERRGK